MKALAEGRPEYGTWCDVKVSGVKRVIRARLVAKYGRWYWQEPGREQLLPTRRGDRWRVRK